jgi:hypothetical protein
MWGSKLLVIMSTVDISVFTLQRLYTLPTIHVSHVAQGREPLKHFQGEWLGIHYEAFTKIP